MSRDPWDSLADDRHVGPDVTGKVMTRLGYRAVPRRSARLRRFAHVGICLSVIAASMVGVAWVVDLGWRARYGSDPAARRASMPPSEERRWEALEESLRPLRRIVDEIEPANPAPAPDESAPPAWLSARAPLGET